MPLSASGLHTQSLSFFIFCLLGWGRLDSWWWFKSLCSWQWLDSLFSWWWIERLSVPA